MKNTIMKWLLVLFACCVASCPLPAWQGGAAAGKRLYVEPFAIRTGSDELREDLVAELRKVTSI